MSAELGRRIRQIRLRLGATRGDPVSLDEFGRLVAKEEGRKTPYTAASVSGWESGAQPTLDALKAMIRIAKMTKEEAHDFLVGESEPQLRETPVVRVSAAAERKKRRKNA